MVKIYGSKMCPDCIRCMLNMDANGLEYEYVDINADLKNLKQFLIYRDTLPIFNHCKEIYDIGVPALVLDDGTVTLKWPDYIRNCGGDPSVYTDDGNACSTDGSGC